MRATLKAAEEELLENIMLSYKRAKARCEGDLQDYILPSLIDDVPTMENILQSALQQLNGRRVRHLKGVWTDLLRTENRVRNLAVFLALKDGLNPQTCSYESPIMPDAEREFLGALGVLTPEPQDLSESEIPPFADDHLVDIYFMVDCNWALVNNFLWCNWGFLELKQVILLTHGLICRPRRFNIVAEHHFALDGIQLALRYSQMLITEVWYSYATDIFCDPPDPVCAIEFPQNLPKWDRPNEKTGYKWCFLPPYLRSGYHSESLVDMSTFDHITFNLDVIQNEYRQIGFAQEYLADLEKLLEGRRIRRIKILGFGRINSLRALKQLAFVLAIKEHFGITEITSQEPVASEFEKGYLNSIGVATPPHDECYQPEEGLEEGEVTLFYWRMLNIHLRSNVVRANQDRLRKLIIIEDVPISAGTKWYPLLPARGKKRMDKKDAKVKERTLKHKAPTERSAKQKFNMRAKSIPLRYDVLQTTPSRSSFPWCPFFGMEMRSYPEDNLRDD